jgi:hypothetical protein
MVLVQTVIGGVATHVFGRLIGLRPVSALVAALAFTLGPFVASQRMFGTVAGQAATWIPVALVGIELALRSNRWTSRFAWCGLAGLAISQIAVSWPGQGLVNALLMIGGWVAYRSLLAPVEPGPPWRQRFIDLVIVGPATLALGLLLAAAGLLPRLAANSTSNIPGGDYTGIVGGNYLATPHSLETLLRDTLVDNWHSRPVALAAPVVILALLAPILARTRYGVPFFAAVTVVGGLLTMGDTIVHRVFYLLPEFEVIHAHSPRRLIWVLFLAPSMLAGAGFEAVLQWRPSRRAMWWLPVPLAIYLAAVVSHARAGIVVGWWPIVLAIATTLLVAAIAISHTERVVTLATGTIVAVMIVFPSGADILRHARDPASPGIETRAEACLDIFTASTDPGGAGEFLQQQQEAGEFFRYAGYAGRDPLSHDASYSFRRCSPAVINTLVGGRAVQLNLETIHGYNPLHLAVYVDYTEVMNGGRQDYHWMDPSPSALAGSPLLDMLNVRYIVVAIDDASDPEVVAAIAAGRTEVFRNESVVVYENPDAFPRAWIVHEVRADDGTGLAQLQDGSVDGHTVAFVDGLLPEVAPATGSETVAVTDWTEETRTAQVTASADGLVVFSEIHDEGWQATVDGEVVDIVQANHALVGVPVAAGTHTIELRYEPPGLRLGLWLSTLTGLAVLAAAIVAFVTQRRSPAGP